MKNFIYILIVAFSLNACSEYQRVLKGEDIGDKFKLGTELYDAGKFSKANSIFVQIVPKYRGKPQAQKLMYMYCKTFYETKDYFTANYQMERFVEAYPKSEKVQEIGFLSAKSYFQLSPVYSKDQEETVIAIEKLQDFINKNPNSEYMTAASDLVRELDYKLEKKAYNIALQYNITGPFHRDYNSAISAFDNFLVDFPGSVFKEDAMFYKFDSAYKLATNSVDWKEAARVEKAIKYYNSLLFVFPETKYSVQLKQMYQELQEIQNQSTTTKS
jgi:outer membrane protein assembly factor BamD